jgi:Spx/MgsR family transcriptional regulator
MNPNPIIVYGIPNCDTVRKARAWLASRDVPLVFHDFRKSGLPPDQVDAWLAECGWEKLLNRKGTSWRALDETTQASVIDTVSARAVLLAQPSTVKRPVVDWGPGAVPRTTVGFDVPMFEAAVQRWRART